MLLLFGTVTGLLFLYSFYDRNTYLFAGYEGITEFSDSSSDAIFKDGKNTRIWRTSALDAAFELAVRAKFTTSIPLDFMSRDAIRRPYDGVVIRFGETMNCERAILFEDDSAICDPDIYFGLVDAIESAN